MANNLTIAETTAWAKTVHLIDTDEPVIGGVDGVSNAQAIALAGRTQWLKALLDAVIVAGGLTPDTALTTQLRDAILSRTPAATATIAGILKLATSALVLAGTDTSTAITPALLAAALAGGAPVVGSVRNLRANLTAVSSAITFYWDECVVATAIGGTAYKITNTGGLTVDMTKTGVGGIDTGSVAANTWYSIYAACNPSTSTKCLFACLASTSSGSVYSGANLPAGYTATALVGIRITNSNSLFSIFQQRDRSVVFPTTTVLATSTAQSSYTPLSLSSVIPVNAFKIYGSAGSSSSGASSVSMIFFIASDANGCGAVDIELQTMAPNSVNYAPFSVLLSTPQTLYYTYYIGQSGQVGLITVSGYDF